MAHGVIAPKEELSLKVVAVFATIEPSINMCAISDLSKFLSKFLLV